MWLIDSAGSIVYLSPALRSWLGVGDELPEPIADLLTLDRASLDIGGRFRGHLTRRLRLPPAIGHDDVDEHHRDAVAHFMILETSPPPSSDTAGPSSDAARSSLILGCLGDFLADTDIAWEDWFGEGGVRQAAKFDEELARFRGQQQRRANLLLAGTSSPSRRLRCRVELACQIRCHVALVGPAGCGAAEIASLIHHASAPQEPYVCLDASLMDAELLEVYAAPVITELRERADVTGTLCLDRLDEMPAEAQTRLIAWLETWPQRLRLLGILRDDPPPENESVQSVPLAATLGDAMAIFPIEFPRLASRREDLELIAAGSARTARFSGEAMKLIQSYPWPGEWAEFTAACQFAAEIVTGDRIGREHLPLAIRSYRPGQRDRSEVTFQQHEVTIAPRQPDPRDFQIDSLDETLGRYESNLIARAISAAQGNKAEAARRLGISRSRLLRKLGGGSPS